MRLRTFLRPLRGDRSITDVCEATGIARGWISMFERGHAVPSAEQATAMVAIYGPPETWYPRGVLDILVDDLGDCPVCGDELEPDYSRRRQLHVGCKRPR